MRTKKQLEQYLAYTVHDRITPPERKPPVKAKRAGTRRGPERDEKYKAFVRSFPCAACGIEGRSEAAHTGNDGGTSMKASDYSCIPLCAACHTQGARAYHRLGREGFERAWGVCCAEIAGALRAAYENKSRGFDQTA